MKINLIIPALIALVIMSSCSTQKSANTSQKMEKASSTEMIKSQTIQLKKGELFVAVVGYQMEKKEDLLEEYFGIIFPPAQKNGFTPLGQLAIDQVAAGNFMANEFVGLFKWPGMESVQAFLGEVSPDQLAKLRVKIWSELKQHMIIVTEDMEMTFVAGKTYEVKMVWSDQMLSADNIKSSGGKVILNKPVAGYEDLGKNESPNNLMIIEWNNKKSAEEFRKMTALKSKKEEAFYTHFTFPE